MGERCKEVIGFDVYPGAGQYLVQVTRELRLTGARCAIEVYDHSVADRSFCRAVIHLCPSGGTELGVFNVNEGRFGHRLEPGRSRQTKSPARPIECYNELPSLEFAQSRKSRDFRLLGLIGKETR